MMRALPKDKKLVPYEVKEVRDKNALSDYVPKGISMTKAPSVWGEADDGEGVIVAVIDTGIDKTHPDLKDRIVDGANFTGTGDYQDDNGHGTHVSGTILGSINGLGVIGMAPKAKVLSLKALDSQGAGSAESVNAALNTAVNWRGENGERVDVISMSLGGPANVMEHKLIKEAVNSGILVVCAAGNSGDGDYMTNEEAYPGAYSEVVEVGAVNYDKQIAHFSNTNKEIDLVAPGVDIISTWPAGRFARLSGTSMATPHVSGGAALIKKIFEKKYGQPLSERKFFSQVIKHTKTLGDISRKAQGNGLLDLTAVPLPEDGEEDKETPEGKSLDVTIKSEELGLPEKTFRLDW